MYIVHKEHVGVDLTNVHKEQHVGVELTNVHEEQHGGVELTNLDEKVKASLCTSF